MYRNRGATSWFESERRGVPMDTIDWDVWDGALACAPLVAANDDEAGFGRAGTALRLILRR